VIVAGVSTVCGNQTVDKTTDNALRVLHLLGRDDVPVHRGADKPLGSRKKDVSGDPRRLRVRWAGHTCRAADV
jgi:inosine-uridine nucleoside N-ribohydrolase